MGGRQLECFLCRQAGNRLVGMSYESHLLAFQYNLIMLYDARNVDVESI